MGVDIKQRSDGHVEWFDEASGIALPVPRVAHVTIATADILTLQTTAVPILAAPGTGKTIFIESITATKAAGTAYASVGSGDDIDFHYTDSSGVIACTIETTGFLDSTAATISHAKGGSVLPVVNAGIVAFLSGAVTTGTSDVKLKVVYHIVANPVF